MSSDELIEFEENGWQALAEEFINKHIKEWEQFVYNKYCDMTESIEPTETEER